MKRAIRRLALLALLVPAASCPPTQDPDLACDLRGCISLRKFSANVVNALNNNQVAGYVSTVGPLQPVSGGLAQTSTDAPPNGLAMAPDLTTNVASTTKIITTIAVLQSLAKHNVALDSTVASYLWTDWPTGPNLGGLTFRQLLTHRSGFRYNATDGCRLNPMTNQPTSCNTLAVNCNGSSTDFATLKQVMSTGVDAANVGVPQYNNCNFAIFRELLPFMEGVTYNGASDDNSKAQWSAGFYVNYVNRYVLQPLGIPARDCQPSNGAQSILSYPNPPGGSNGTDWGNVWELACAGGGWQLSADDLYKITNELANGHTLLSDVQRRRMNVILPGLGWDNTVSACPDPYPCKNGNLSGADNIWTYMGIFKCGVPVVVVVNSALPAPYQDSDNAGNPLTGVHTNINGLVSTAYNAAIVSDAGVCCNGETACGAQCCGVANPVCCGGACCGTGECIGGKCCTPERACGATCCPSGRFCNGGACVAGCPSGTDISTSPTGTKMCCPLYQCSNPRNGDVCVPNSCPNVCCAAGQVCCSTDGFVGHQGCNDPVSCFKG